MSTADLHLHTLFVLNGDGRIISTRDPSASPGPLFCLIRSATRCTWAVRADVPKNIAAELDRLAREEPPVMDLRDAPVHAREYESLVTPRVSSGDETAARISQSAGLAFAFPDTVAEPDDIVFVEDERLLQHHFRGWVVGEIAAGGRPVAAVIMNGYPVSVCFSARSSDAAAEAGVETSEPFRRRGFASRVTAAWALAVRASGRIPLYSTSWTNTASLAVARKLGLTAYASSWSLSE